MVVAFPATDYLDKVTFLKYDIVKLLVEEEFGHTKRPPTIYIAVVSLSNPGHREPRLVIRPCLDGKPACI
jgi:hypothetical protein